MTEYEYLRVSVSNNSWNGLDNREIEQVKIHLSNYAHFFLPDSHISRVCISSQSEPGYYILVRISDRILKLWKVGHKEEKNRLL